MTLSDLIPRIESGEGEDRELDGRIMFDLFAKPVGDHDYLWPEDHPSWLFAIRLNIDPFKARAKVGGETIAWPVGEGAWLLMNALRVPRLTSSVDAVLALMERVLPGWGWEVWRADSDVFAEVWRADGGFIRVHATSPARALLVAALRALS